MSYEFKKLSEVQAMDEVPEGAKVLAEVNGEIRRVPGSGLGGDTGIKTAIIKSSDYDQALHGVQPPVSAPEVEITYSCINMTFEEAYETLASGEPMKVHFMIAFNGATNLDGVSTFAGTTINGVPCIILMYMLLETKTLYWTPDGFSTTKPGPQ